MQSCCCCFYSRVSVLLSESMKMQAVFNQLLQLRVSAWCGCVMTESDGVDIPAPSASASGRTGSPPGSHSHPRSPLLFLQTPRSSPGPTWSFYALNPTTPPSSSSSLPPPFLLLLSLARSTARTTHTRFVAKLHSCFIELHYTTLHC